MWNSVIVASNANFLMNTLKEILKDVSFKVYEAADDNELSTKINSVFPRYIFLENCFHGYCTDDFIQKIRKHNRNIKIAVWAACEVKPVAAARFIAAGAETFFSLRDSYQNVKNIVYRISEGQSYCPADVETVLERECAYPVVGKELTRREMEVAKLLITGKRNNEICDILSLTIHTVKRHKLNIYRKYGADNSIDILRKAVVSGIVSFDDFI